jgi:hypothetical protein
MNIIATIEIRDCGAVEKSSILGGGGREGKEKPGTGGLLKNLVFLWVEVLEASNLRLRKSLGQAPIYALPLQTNKSFIM